jgi:hypothetical protein
LKAVQPIGEYQDLVTIEMELIENRSFKVLCLDQLIEAKASLPRPKDRTVEAELRAIRELLRGRESR